MPIPMTTYNSSPLGGRIRVPGDKSISHRALIVGALACGQSEIEGLLQSEDVLATAAALEALGVSIERGEAVWRVHGRGVGGLSQPSIPIDFGNSGTAARLMMGAIAGHDMSVSLIGDESLSRRPMGRVLTPLKEMGVEVAERDKSTLPLTLKGSSELIPIEYHTPVASAQVKSAVLLAGIHAAGETSVIERQGTRDHTERMLRHFGGTVDERNVEGGRRITVRGDAELEGARVVVPGDPSSAAFLVAAALVVPGSEVTIEGVLANPTRTGFYVTLKEMGADVAFLNPRDQGGEPVADIRVRAGVLKGVTVPPSRAPSMIDEYPMLAGVAAFADGETRMEGVGELRVKESDRLAATLAGLAACGVEARAEGDTLIVNGGGRVPGGGQVATELDHRIAMAFLIVGLASEQSVSVDDATMIGTSFPEFAGLLASLGGKLSRAVGEV